MKNCKWFEKYFSDYIEENLSHNLVEELKKHFDKCTRCTAIINQMRIVKTRLGQLVPLKTSTDFNTVLRTRIRIESGLERSPWHERMGGWSIRVPIYAASLAIILMVAFFINEQIEKSNPYVPNSPRSIAVLDSNFSNTKPTHFELPIYTIEYFINSPTDSSYSGLKSNYDSSLDSVQFRLEKNQRTQDHQNNRPVKPVSSTYTF